MFQKFHLNRIKYLVLILLSITFISNVKAIVKPTNNFYINDYANILSSETEEYVLNKSVALSNVDGTQIVVVTVQNLEGYTIESYANKLFRNFGIGDSNKNNGLLFLIALEERELRIEVGYGLEGIINDGKAGRIRDEYIVPYLKNNEWDEGIKNGYDALYKEIVIGNNLNVDYDEPIEVGSSDGIIISRPGYENYGIEIIAFFYLISISGNLIGGKIRKLKKNKNIYTILYFVAWIGVTIFFYYTWFLYMFFMFFNLIAFLFGRFSSVTIGGNGFYSGGGFSGRGGSSGGGFSGGGGSSGGGGASGRF